ncbi:MAG: L,D-transpeptidase [Thermoleophilia bacterium]
MPRRPLIATAALCMAVPMCAPLTAADTPAAMPGPPTLKQSWAARVMLRLTARTAPDATAKRVMTVNPVAPLGGDATILQVTGRAVDATGHVWLRVRLPVRPNGTQGWLPADPLELRLIRLRVRVVVHARRLILYRSGRPIMRITVAVGARKTPTPTGHFAVAELIRTGDPKGFLGPVVMPLTAYSATLNEYAGGNGRVAMHGTSLPELLGTAASHGCIRIRNSDVQRLARIVRPGTPVDIVP